MWPLYRLGFWLRETGQALEKLGYQLQGNYAYREQLNRSRSVMNLFDKAPVLGRNVFIAPNALVSGDVRVGNNSSVFYGSVVRGDTGSISIGDNTNIQDGTTVSTSSGSLGTKPQNTVIGSNVTIGHQASIHGCSIEAEALIGMGATLLEGSKIEKGAMVAAGATVQPGTIVPAGEIWGGNPAKHLRPLNPEEKSFLSESAEHYVNVSAEHLKITSQSLRDIAKEKGILV